MRGPVTGSGMSPESEPEVTEVEWEQLAEAIDLYARQA